MKKVNVLGSEYSLISKKYEEDGAFERRGIAGYCDGAAKRIIVCDITTYPGMLHEQEDTQKEAGNKLLRHEIVHAFLYESGLDCNGCEVQESWAINEEMVDWIAMQGPKIYKAWQEADAL